MEINSFYQDKVALYELDRILMNPSALIANDERKLP